MKKIKIISFLMILICSIQTMASAAVLGFVTDSYSIPVGEGTVFTHTKYFSDQAGVGEQTENYLVYQPNDLVKPIITYGDYLYGAGRTTDEMKKLIAQGRYPVAGTNADFFSLQTGVPMSNLIIDGKIVTKDVSNQYGIGFLEDGSAFMSQFSIKSTMIRQDGTRTPVNNINKYRQPYAIYLMTDEFSEQTRNTSVGVDVLLSPLEGEIALGEQMTAKVESVTENYTSVPIPKGKFMLTVDNNAPKELYQSLVSLAEGEIVTFEFEVEGDERWNDVTMGFGALGGMLLSGGEINTELEKGAAPRTAFGLTADGKMVLYTLDGRQPGYSYGAQLKTLAKRMKELGCTDAVNLDGGGSTTFVAALPGMEHEILNSPSDASERRVSTYFLFENTQNPSDEADKLFIYPRTAYLLKGASVKLDTKAVDKNYYPVKLPGKIVYSVEEGSGNEVTDEGVFTANRNGQQKVTARIGDLTADIFVTCLETPTDIHIINRDTDKRLTGIELKRGEQINLDAIAFGGYNKLVSSFELFDWSVDEGVGKLSDDGTFTAADDFGITGKITVTAGAKTVSIPVSVVKNGREKEEDLRFEISAEVTGNILSGTVLSKYSNVAKEIKVFVDGEEQDAEFDGRDFLLTLPTGWHKINISVLSEEGYTDVKYIYSDENMFENPFVDTELNWAKNILSYLHGRKIISGENTELGLVFRPQKQMTRAEFAVMCSNYLEIDLTKYMNEIMPFSDAEDIPEWAENQMKALYYKGIINGRGEGENLVADPHSNITRAEAATIISRLLQEGMKREEFSATDKDEIPGWAIEGMEILYAAGVLNGYEDGSIKPLGLLTKAEAAKLFYAIM